MNTSLKDNIKISIIGGIIGTAIFMGVNINDYITGHDKEKSDIANKSQIRTEDVNKDGLADMVLEWGEGKTKGREVFYNDGKGNYVSEKARERR